MFNLILTLLISHTVRLLLYVDYLDVDYFYFMCDGLKISISDNIRTNCNNIAESLAYLLNFRNCEYMKNYNLNPKKGYVFYLRGVSSQNKFTSTSHAFVVINHNSRWIILDGYINCHGIDYRIMDLSSIVHLLTRLEEKFDEQSWIFITKCASTDYDEKTTWIHISIKECDYDFDNILNNFNQLVEKSSERLNFEEKGRSNRYLALLDKNLNVQTAEKYLKSLS